MSGWSWICSEADRVSSGARTTTANRAERTRAVCDGLRAALAAYGAPEQILTDNAKVFTGRFFHPPVEVLLDRICRENGIEHLLTPRAVRRQRARSSGLTAACALNSSVSSRLSPT